MVHADKYHPIHEQSRFVPLEASPIPVEQLLSRLFGRQRCAACRKVPPVAIQPGESSTPEPIPTVSSRVPNANRHVS